MQGKRRVRGPRVELGVGELAHQVDQELHAVAVEGRQQQAPVLEVQVLVQQDQRVTPEDRLEYARALAGVGDIRRQLEDLLDLVGVRDHHQRWLEGEVHRDPAAVAAHDRHHRHPRAQPGAEQLRCGR